MLWLGLCTCWRLVRVVIAGSGVVCGDDVGEHVRRVLALSGWLSLVGGRLGSRVVGWCVRVICGSTGWVRSLGWLLVVSWLLVVGWLGRSGDSWLDLVWHGVQGWLRLVALLNLVLVDVVSSLRLLVTLLRLLVRLLIILRHWVHVLLGLLSLLWLLRLLP